MFMVVDSSQRCPTTTLAPFVYWYGRALPNVCNGREQLLGAAAHMGHGVDVDCSLPPMASRRIIRALERAKIGLQCRSLFDIQR